MVGITEFNKMNNELIGLGYSMKYSREWQPKTTLYRHKPAYNNEGELTDDIGTSVTNVPGEPSYVLKKAKIGLFAFPPSESCVCRWCKERDWSGTAKAEIVEAVPTPSGKQKGTKRMGPFHQSS